MNRADRKIIVAYYAPPSDRIKLSCYELRILGIIKNLGVASINEIIDQVNPEYKNYPEPYSASRYSFKERIAIVRKTIGLTMELGNIVSAIKKLKEVNCVRIEV